MPCASMYVSKKEKKIRDPNLMRVKLKIVQIYKEFFGIHNWNYSNRNLSSLESYRIRSKQQNVIMQKDEE